jgi:hypothetical protein
MEADWEIEIGGTAPAIDAHWKGFVDLRVDSQLASQLLETAELPALATTLVRLNAPSSPVWTSKCDVWQPEAFDPDELDARAGENAAIACYIDLLPTDNRRWFPLESAIRWSKRVCSQLRCRTLRSCRADIIVRRAVFPTLARPDQLDLGVTAYLTACGPTRVAAGATLSSALAVFADCAASSNFSEGAASKLQ